MAHSSIEVSISFEDQYEVHVGQDIRRIFPSFCSNRYSREKIIVVIDEKVHRLHGEKVQAVCDEYFQDSLWLSVPEGERSKSLGQWQSLIDRILGDGVERGTPLLAVGGGVSGDLAGFVAASTLRGIPLIHMPTTLLAMVDSSIGGKTGLNHDTGKNLIGAFYQPDAVFADTAFLQTLEQKEWITGMAEVLKYAAIRSPELFDQVAGLSRGALEPGEEWAQIISESIRIKTDIVEEDTLEAGKRAFLNFGHTFGHALEKVAGYGSLSHGEAVFAGMIAATYFSQHLGHPVDDIRFAPFLPLYKQQIQSMPTDIEALIEAMKTDKKVKDNTLQLVLLKDWGSPYIHPCTDFSMLREAWQYTLAQFNVNIIRYK
ncbi:3-dehydroquinate synthase [Fodinibius sediminis]|uniref:3-dehydroquinate synthase n=1 Tax=Fodinibius sediminis TaxID=1214077 RepID=A0A521D0U4_9BACT|nr:3-dehydroquinate synthase [Fodinibius sediminis]SMO65317.1 3-dehydroquinate synthase [Fodinibius sediminis]